MMKKEQGERALLNLGHTFLGMQIESYLGYGVWLHGEAVATGMVMAADLSHRLGWISAEDVERKTKRIIITCPFTDIMSTDSTSTNFWLICRMIKSAQWPITFGFT